MKPHIFLDNGEWICLNADKLGVGRTPRIAWICFERYSLPYFACSPRFQIIMQDQHPERT